VRESRKYRGKCLLTTCAASYARSCVQKEDLMICKNA